MISSPPFNEFFVWHIFHPELLLQGLYFTALNLFHVTPFLDISPLLRLLGLALPSSCQLMIDEIASFKHSQFVHYL